MLLAALHGLILVFQLVQLELEQVSEIVGGLLTAPAPAPAALLLLLDVPLVRLLCLLEEPQRLLLVGHRLLKFFGVQVFDGPRHGFERLREDCRNIPEALIGLGEPTILHPLKQRGHLILQPCLSQADGYDVLTELLIGVRVPLAHQVEGGGDDLSLRFGQRGLGPTAATAATPTLLLGLAISSLEGADVQEVDVTRDGPRCSTAVVPHHRVVGHEVAYFELPLFEEERVPGRHLRKRCAPPLKDRYRVFGEPVDRVDEIDGADPVVVIRDHLEVYLFDGGSRHVATGRREANGRVHVGQHVNPVLGRCRDHLAVIRSGQLQRVEAALADREASGKRAVGFDRQIAHHVAVEKKLTGIGQHGRLDVELDYGPGQGGYVSSSLDYTGLEPGVAGEEEGEVDLVDVRQVRNIDHERSRANTRRLDEVLGRLIHAE